MRLVVVLLVSSVASPSPSGRRRFRDFFFFVAKIAPAAIFSAVVKFLREFMGRGGGDSWRVILQVRRRRYSSSRVKAAAASCGEMTEVVQNGRLVG